MTSKTIDNLGLDNSVRYAMDQEVLDKSVLSDSKIVSSQVEVEVTTPIYSEYLDSFLGIQRVSPWAVFYPPNLYNMQKKRIFTSSTIPSLGSEEYIETQVERIKNQHDQQKEKRQKQPRKEDFAWEEERNQRDEDKETMCLIHLFEAIQLLDKDLTMIHGRRSQYMKG